jgi:glycosyltransferase involved in cell wall biosynthesis
MSEKSRIKVIVPFYNPGDYFDLCINSILTQDFEGYDILFIDDGSNDGSYEKIPACTFKTNEKGEPLKDEEGRLIIEERHTLLESTKCDKINAWKASERLTALPNIHNGIVNFCENPDDIVFLLYGDDWLPSKNVLKRIYEEYQNEDCLMTYGSARLSDGKKSYSSAYTEKEFKSLRMVTPKFSWPLTFKKSLYDQFIKTDKNFDQFKDEKGEWFKMCSNYAIAYPLLNLAGHSKVKHINDCLYVYNIDNPLNSEKTNPDLYYKTLDAIQNKEEILADTE